MLKPRFHLLPQTLFVCLLLLLPQAALAAAYSLPADIGSGPFSSCSGTGPVYNCSGNVSLGNNDSVTLTADVTLNINGDFDVGKNVVIDNNGFLLGFDATGDIDVDDGAQVNADLISNGKIDIGKGVVANGNMTASDDITINDDAIVSGNIDTGGKLDIKKKVIISGDVTAIDDIKIGDDANITGNVSTTGKIDIDKNVVLVGDLTAVGDIKIGDDANITGNITSGGKIEVNKRGLITGDLNANDDIKIEQDIVINGDVTTTGNLDIDNNSVVNGVCTPFHPNCTGGPPGSGCETFRDEFSATAYSNQNGTLNWSTDWNEVADDGSPSGGSIRINASALRLEGGAQPATVLGGRFIEREADLSSFGSATLSFNYRETGGWEASDIVEVYLSSDGGLSWNLVHTFTDDQGATYQPFSTNISAYISVNTRIAFVNKADNKGEKFYFDNVQIEGCGSVVLIDHFRITPATTAASTCLPNAITIVAEDASNNLITGYTNLVNITVSTSNGNWSVNSAINNTSPNPDNDDNGAVSYTFDSLDIGDIVLNLTNTHAEALTITVDDPVEAVSSTSVVIVYSSNVFVVTEDSIQVAGRPMAMNVAMWTDDLAGSGSCGIDTNYNYPAITIDANIDRGGVLTAANDPTISAVTVPDAPSTNAVTLNFSVTPGQASFNLDSNDVGQYRLTLTDNSNTHGNTSITGVSNLLTVRPFGIAVNAIEVAPGPIANPGGSAPADAIFTTAGNDFSATVSGVLWIGADDTNNDGVLDAGVYENNPVAPSYAWDTTLSVSALVTSYTPSPGTPGMLNNGNILLAEFGAGSFTVTDLQYTEVGSFTLQSRATDFLGEPSADLVGDDIVVGRFIPAIFEVAINNNGTLAETCTAYTYIGEDFSYDTPPNFTVTARSALGAITAQYRDGFVKLGANSVAADASQDDSTPGSDLNPLNVSYTIATMGFTPQNDGTVDYAFGADIFRYGPDAPLTGFSKEANSQVAPFTADINPEISSVSDGEVTTNYAAGTHLLDPTGNSLRFGRLRMENVFGSELNPLTMPVIAEYWSGSFFEKNTLDTCTVIVDADLVSTPVPAGLLSVPTVLGAPASAGDIDYSYPAPGAGNDGHVDTTTDLNLSAELWLRFDWDLDGEFDNDPFARANFGIFEGNPVQIYIQQIYEQ